MEKLTEMKRIAAVFTNPRKAMEDVGRFPTILVPLMCTIVFPVLSVVMSLDYLRDMYMQNLAAVPGAAGVDPGFLMQVQLYSTLVTILLSSVAGWFFYGLMVLILSHIFGGDGEMGYKKALSLTGYAYLVTVPFTILSSVLLNINPGYPLTFSLLDILKLVAPSENIYLTTFLSMLSLFRIWETVIVAIGIKVIKQTTTVKAIAIVVILFVLQYAVTIASNAGAMSLLGMAG